MKQFRSFAFLIIFFTLSLVPLAAMPFYVSTGSSEKRVLQGMPELLENGMPNMEFFSQMNDYFSDHFAYRENLAQMNEVLHTGILQYSINEKVIFGRDGWLYYGETADDYTGRTGMDDDEMFRLARVLSLECEYLDSLGIEYIFTVAPNKNTIYPEYMPGCFIKASSPTLLEKLSSALKATGVSYCDITAGIMDAKNEENILYYRTDSHWNELGARVAYNCLMRDFKLSFPEFVYDDLSSLKTVETTTGGDLERMLFPLRKESNEGCTALSEERMYTALGPFTSVEDASVTTMCSANQYRIMMFRDSFGNALIPFISNNFGYAFYSREFPVTFIEVDKHKPDMVIQEIAQRNIPKLIERAPVMPALERMINFTVSTDRDGRIFAEDEGNLTHIYGFLCDVDEKAYRCYITLTGGKTWEAFPVLEAEKIGGKPECGMLDIKDASGFSLYLNNRDFSGKSVRVNIDFGDRAISHTFSVEEVER